ncbi:MAG: aminoglycoside phosphotransferase family protein [Propionibacteriaceae bacterium]|nr:aminoglycoside phosphotransferase family protein [Propionibacteriaceae bacterium]
MDDSPALLHWVRSTAAIQDPRVDADTPVSRMLIPDVVTRPQRPEHSKVFICGGVVVKLHEQGTKRSELANRLQAVDSLAMERIWLLPLSPRPLPAPNEQLATIWPRATLVSSVENPPWEDAAELLAKLHLADVKALPKLPTHGGLARFERAVKAARGISSEPWLAPLGAELYHKLRKPAVKLPVHGAWHLGQLGHPLLSRPWRLLDPDDLGLGDPAWDLARPAALYSAGKLSGLDWARFVNAYRAAGGPAVPEKGDPWPALADAAQATLFISAVHALTNIGSHSAETTQTFLAALR